MSSFTKVFIFGGLVAMGIPACGAPGALGEQPTLTGQIDGWNQGAGFTLGASVLGMPTGAAPLTTAAIDAAGNFRITLPSAAALAPYLVQQHVVSNQQTPGCTGPGVQVDPTDFATTILSLKATSGTIALPIYLKVPPTIGVVYVYVDRTLNESGNFSCTFGTMQIQESFDIHLSPGWNTEISTNLGTSVSGNSGAVPAGAKWLTQ